VESQCTSGLELLPRRPRGDPGVPDREGLAAGSGLTFADTGEHELKGVPDRWRLYRVVDE
jgi:hypothetical protein